MRVISFVRETFGRIAALATAWDAKGSGFCPSSVPVAAAPPQAKHARASIAPSAMARLRQVPLALSTFLQIESERHIDISTTRIAGITHARRRALLLRSPQLPRAPCTAPVVRLPPPSAYRHSRAAFFPFCTIPLPILGPRCLAGRVPPCYVSQSSSSSPARLLSPRGLSAPQPARAAARHSLPETDAYRERPRDTRYASSRALRQ